MYKKVIAIFILCGSCACLAMEPSEGCVKRHVAVPHYQVPINQAIAALTASQTAHTAIYLRRHAPQLVITLPGTHEIWDGMDTPRPPRHGQAPHGSFAVQYTRPAVGESDILCCCIGFLFGSVPIACAHGAEYTMDNCCFCPRFCSKDSPSRRTACLGCFCVNEEGYNSNASCGTQARRECSAQCALLTCVMGYAILFGKFVNLLPQRSGIG